jgi:hypothetical protein
MEKWGRYLNWRMYPRWTNLLGMGVGFMLMALLCGIASTTLETNSTEASIVSINQVEIVDPGTYIINQYTDGHMIISQDDTSGETVPYVNKPIPEVDNDDFLYKLLKLFMVFSFLAGIVMWFLYVYRYIEDRNDYVAQQVQAWVDSGKAKLPTTESVIEFIKNVREGKQ